MAGQSMAFTATTAAGGPVAVVARLAMGHALVGKSTRAQSGQSPTEAYLRPAPPAPRRALGRWKHSTSPAGHLLRLRIFSAAGCSGEKICARASRLLRPAACALPVADPSRELLVRAQERPAQRPQRRLETFHRVSTSSPSPVTLTVRRHQHRWPPPVMPSCVAVKAGTSYAAATACFSTLAQWPSVIGFFTSTSKASIDENDSRVASMQRTDVDPI